MAKGKLRHLAISCEDLEATAELYSNTFGLRRVGSAKGPTADGIYLSDGTVNLPLLRYKEDEPMGEGKDRNWFGPHHIGFWVDDSEKTSKEISEAGGKWFMGEMAVDNAFYEVKYTDPDGIIFDITHNGWGGAKKDGP